VETGGQPLSESSRDTTPSIDENGKPFHLPFEGNV